MNKKTNDKKNEIGIDSIAENWANLILAQIEYKRQRDGNQYLKNSLKTSIMKQK